MPAARPGELQAGNGHGYALAGGGVGEDGRAARQTDAVALQDAHEHGVVEVERGVGRSVVDLVIGREAGNGKFGRRDVGRQNHLGKRV